MTYVNLGLAVWPVGSIYLSSNATSPSIIFGGTWTPVAVDENRLLMFSDTGALQTGGSNTHTHGHSNLKAAVSSRRDEIVWKYSSTQNWYPNYSIEGTSNGTPVDPNYHTDGAELLGELDNAENIPAYITVYGWYRVA